MCHAESGTDRGISGSDVFIVFYVKRLDCEYEKIISAYCRRSLQPLCGLRLARSQVEIAPGDSIQAAVNANPEGTVFIIKAGIHRLQTIIPKNRYHA
jgi:hypothetical protein